MTGRDEIESDQRTQDADMENMPPVFGGRDVISSDQRTAATEDSENIPPIFDGG